MYRHPIGLLSRGAVLDVGLKCTHSCAFCYYSYLDKSDDQFRGMRRASFRTLAECKAILDGLAQHGFVNFDYTGGEPSLHPDIVEITRYAHRELGLAGRMITLGQFLMRRMPNCTTERLLDDLLDAGLVNFLFSFHAAEPELFHRITGEQLGRLEAAMDHLDARGFQYTANTTVFEWNFRHLPEIARAVLKHRIYLHNFILMNAYYEWNQDGRAFGVQARYSEIAPYLREAVAILEDAGVGVNIRYGPMCSVRGMEKNLVGMVGVRYDAYEWMNRAGHLGGPPEECAAPLPVGEGQIESHLAFQPLDQHLPNGVHVIGARGHHLKEFPKACGSCKARAVCDGVDPNYLRQHGDSEFVPYTEGSWPAPVHAERARYAVPFLVKTAQDEDMKAACAEAFHAPTPSAPGDAPRVSVVVTCYNYARYLPDSVGSVLAQTYRDFEVIVVDDGSTDDSTLVAERLRAEHPGERITVVRQANSGQPAIARNAGIARARGAYVLCLDADDMVAPTMLAECAELLEREPSVAIAYTDRRDFDGVEQIVLAGEYDFPRLRHANHLSYCALFRREAWEAVGGYRTNVRGCEDWDFWVAAGARGYAGKRIPRPLFLYRRHDTGVYQDVVNNLAALGARIVLNNREAYSPDEITSAERSLATHVPALVSVIIPTRNRPERLAKALASVLGQTWPRLEAIVVNDGGDDVEAVVSRLDQGGRATYVRVGTTRERAAARNAGLRVARGEYVAYLDDDDWFEPDHVETLVAALEQSGRAVAYSDAQRVSERLENGAYVETGRDVPYSFDFDADQLLVGNHIPILCVMHRRDCLDAVGPFDEQLETHEDWELLLRLSRRYPFVHVPQVTCAFTWRQDGSSTTSRRRADFVRTAEYVHALHAAPVAGRPDLLAGRARYVEGLRRAAEGAGFTCSVVIATRGGVEQLRVCLTELAQVTHGVDYEAVIVDVGSTDGTGAFLAALGGDVQVIRTEASGLAAALNLGAGRARGRHLVFLSPDTAPTEGWLAALVAEAEADADTAVVGGKLLHPDGSVWHAGFAVSRVHGVPYPIYRGFPSNLPGASRRREAQAVSGACLLVRQTAFAAAGGFDEAYHERFADVDLCLRIGAAGGRVVYQPRAVLFQREETDGSPRELQDGERLQQQWTDRWLADEDATYVADGYAYRVREQDGITSETLEPLPDPCERARWERVAEVQRVAQRLGIEAARPLLDEPEAWPDDPEVLRWAALMCVRAGVSGRAADFWSRVLTTHA
jgi:glycosyltransferase involved in cell wall biosynthesis